jgi:hypothetical protein
VQPHHRHFAVMFEFTQAIRTLDQRLTDHFRTAAANVDFAASQDQKLERDLGDAGLVVPN